MISAATFTGALSIATTAFFCLNKRRDREVKCIPLFEPADEFRASLASKQPSFGVGKGLGTASSPGGASPTSMAPSSEEPRMIVPMMEQLPPDMPPSEAQSGEKNPLISHPIPPPESCPLSSAADQPGSKTAGSLKRPVLDSSAGGEDMENRRSPTSSFIDKDQFFDALEEPEELFFDLDSAHEPTLPEPVVSGQAVPFTAYPSETEEKKAKLLDRIIAAQKFADFVLNCFHRHNPSYKLNTTKGECWYAYGSTRKALDQEFDQLRIVLLESPGILDFPVQSRELLCLMPLTLLAQDPTTLGTKFAISLAIGAGQLNPAVVHSTALSSIKTIIKECTPLEVFAAHIGNIAYWLSPVIYEYLRGGRFQDELYQVCIKVKEIKPGESDQLDLFNQQFEKMAK